MNLSRPVRWLFFNKPPWLRLPRRFYEYINSLYCDPDSVIIYKRLVDYIVLDGLKYGFNNEVNSLMRADSKYHWFDNIKPTDVCLDVGACIGAFTIPAAMKAKHVCAVEPVWDIELKENIKLNDLHNVVVLPFAIGDGKSQTIRFGEKEKQVSLVTFDALIKDAPRFNVAKIDCEGAEWTFGPELLKGIREIHFEFHIRRSHSKSDWQKYDHYLDWFINNGYKTDIIVDNRHLGWTCPFEANIGIRAVKQ